MKTTLLRPTAFLLTLFFFFSCKANTEEPIAYDSMIINHTCTKLFDIPMQYIEAAKQQLIIAYGHTSHGSQIISGMEGLDNYMTLQGYSSGLFRFNSDGSNNALELRDSPFDNAYDLGNPDFTEWASATRKYLNSHSEVNVVMWSWCGQVSWASTDDINGYLSRMTQLESDFPKVKFVYMTGHLDGSGKDGQLNQNNNRIREYCSTNKKILFDFADIESYDPDANVNYMELLATDNCDYTTSSGESKNWAIDWQESHVKNLEWYECDAAHSQALNGNRKAYAAWYLFARLAGWEPDGGSSVVVENRQSNHFDWSIVNNCLKIITPVNQKINKIELFDLQGRTFACDKIIISASGAEVYIPKGSFLRNQSAIFRVITDQNSYSGKFMPGNL